MKLLFKYKTPLYQGRMLLLALTGAFCSLLIVGYVSSVFLPVDYPLLVASMGAALVIIYLAPGNLMAQPWPLVAGHLVSAAVGVTCLKLIPDKILAAACAVTFAMLAMHYLRCLHPPGGAAALIPIVGGSQFSDLGYTYVIAPVGINALIVLVFAIFFMRVWGKANYPADYSQVDHTDEDMQQYAQRDPFFANYVKDKPAYKAVYCRDIMQPLENVVQEGVSLEEVSKLLRMKQNQEIVAVNKSGHFLGLLTAASLSFGIETCAGGQAQHKSLSDLQLKRIATVRDDQPIESIMPLLEQQDIKQVMIVDKKYRPLGWLKPPSS